MVVMYNDRLLLNALVKIFGRSKTLAPIFKTAVSYPMDNRGRTARVLAIFSLIIFTITVLAMIMGLINGNIDQITKEQSGSYDMMVTSNNPHTPLTGLEFEIEESENLSSGDFDVIVPLYTSMSLVYGIDGELPEAERGEIIEANLSRPLSEFQDDASWYDLVGCPAVFFQESDYELSEWDEDAYGDGDDDYKKVWDAVRDNDSLAIVDGTVVPEEFGPREEGLTLKLGDYILVRDTQNHSKVVKVVGITKQRLVRGVFVVQSVVTVEMEAETSSVALLKFDEDVSKKEQVEIAKDMESELVVYGMRTFIIEQELKDMLRSMTNFFYLLQAFLGLGLLVGIAGLGIITIRVVTERRQQIGMLRALGFKQSMIKLSFLIETSFIALLGIFIGVALGIILGVRMWMQDFQDGNVAFVIPWGTIIIISLISYVFTFLCTYAPASAAAKIPPAEALRYIG
jgi:putative ABC transport system permease protein